MDTQKLVEKLSNLSGEKSKDIRLEDQSKLLTKNIYDFLKTEEGKLGIPRLRNALPYLHIDDMTAEQIWQQIELHNSTVISMSTDQSSLNEFNLCIKIAELSSQFINNEDEEDNEETDVDDGVELEDETEEENEKDEDRTSDFDDDDIPSEEEDQVKEDTAEDVPDNLSEFSDLDKDTFGDIAVEGDNSDDNDDDKDDDDAEDKDPLDENKLHDDPPDESDYEDSDVSKPKQSFRFSQVDSKFFNLRESEWIADNDIIGKSFDDDDDDDVDFMKDSDTEQTDDEGKDAMYDAFFDPPSTDDAQPQEEDSEQNKKSKFEASVAREASMKEDLEKEMFLTEKPWILKGEVQKKERPENSALEHHLEYNVAIRQKPIITEETTKNIEKIILDRIRSKCWDDVERKIKPIADPFQFKQKLVLDEEKSKKSLAAIYEEEFVRKQQEEQNGVRRTLSSILAESDEKCEELPIHKEIKKEMDDLFMKLDALSNCHYTPRYRPPEIRVVSNLPAVTIEEATPAAVSDATLLAPQEVVAPLRGELKGETEKDKTDKNRQRRGKKKHQHARSKREEEKLNKQLKIKDKDGLMRKDASVKFVQKAAKQGFIKALDNNQQNSVKTSKGFFDQLQNNVAERTNQKRKRQDEKEESGKKKSKPLTMTRLLL